MNPLLDQLHDIEGLDPIGRWPLAPGWWIMIALGIFAICAITGYIVYRLAFMRSWKNDTFKKLTVLEKNLSDETAAASAIALSEYLRRIAIKRFSRKECAGLTGQAWLKWLAAHDPKGFDWEKNGVLLVDAPYAPMHKRLTVNEIKNLIQAIRDWVR